MLGFELGADDFLAKPVQVDDLLARISNLFARELERSTQGDLTVP